MPTTSQTRRAFENKATVKFRDGKELNGWIVDDNTRIARVTISKSNKDIPKGTLSNMAKYLYIDVQTLCEFVNCTINGPELIRTIVANKARQ